MEQENEATAALHDICVRRIDNMKFKAELIKSME